MISTRFAVAVGLLISIAAVAIGIVALMNNVRDDGAATGRLVQTRLTNAYDGDPMLFPLDDFFMSRDRSGHMHALYVYTPGFFGHTRGCRVVWDPNTTLQTSSGTRGPGLFIDPCGGARFDRDGSLVAGPSDHDLDHFTTSAGVEGILVDTKKLYCGRDATTSSTTDSGADPTPTPESPPTCERVLKDAR